MNEKILNTVWNWAHDKNHEVNGLGYVIDNNLVALHIIERCQVH